MTKKSTPVFALIFAGGMGERMKGARIPKQFLEIPLSISRIILLWTVLWSFVWKIGWKNFLLKSSNSVFQKW